MTKQEFREFVEKHTVILDGATGSNLMKAGMPIGVCTEAWVLEHPETLISLQREYVAAGSNIIYAPTFTGNRIKLSEYHLYDQMEEMMTKLVQLSKEAVGDKALIAGDVTMTGRQLAPMGDLPFEELVDIYKEQIGYLVKAGVDLLVIETMLSLQECRAALIAAKEVCDLPVMVTLTFEMDGKTLYGTDARTAAIVLDKLGADAIGANCSTGPVEMANVLRMMAEVTRKPLIGKPNAGLPKVDGEGKTYYDMDADAFYEGMKHIMDAGASIIGGCCGTTPAYIEKIAKLEKKKINTYQEKRYLSSERKTLAFGLDDPFMVVGERINPTGKKALQASLREGSMDLVIEFAEQQEAAGASILDVNMGMSGVDEKELMVKAVEELSVVTSLPLSLDSSMPEVLEAALRIYPGRALVNSVSLEEVKIQKILPLVKKYGAMFILLPVSDEGLPKDAEEKNHNIEKILEYAYEIGLTKEDIVVDGLVATVGAEKEAAIKCLDTIRHCKESELATICGLSNISFGLPERPYVNSAFLTMAIANGLTMAIMNPNQEIMLCAAYASDLLLAKEESDIRYIEFASELAEKHRIAAEEAEKNRLFASQNGVILDVSGKKIETSSDTSEENSGIVRTSEEEQLFKDVLKGNKKTIVDHVKDCLAHDSKPQGLLDDILLPAINDVGAFFDQGRYFLPQLIASAESMKLAIEYLEPLLKAESTKEDMPTVVIATVAGDVHDIGKNLVAMMLKNYGFTVIDLGKDVDTELIVNTAIEENAKIIGLSALMTTTMQEMRVVVKCAKEKGYTGKIMVGGAVVTQEFADEIGADGYSKDAAEAVKVAEKLCGLA